MKALTLVTLVVLIALGVAQDSLASQNTGGSPTPYNFIYAWYENIMLFYTVAFVYTNCLYMGSVSSFLTGDGGYAILACLNSLQVHNFNNPSATQWYLKSN